MEKKDVRAFRPINDFIVIKTLKESHESSGLELYTKNNEVRYNYGLVISASERTVLNDGDKVYYDSISGSELRHNGEKYLILRERDIAIIDNE